MLFGLRRLLSFEDNVRQVGRSWFRSFFEVIVMVVGRVERLFA